MDQKYGKMGENTHSGHFSGSPTGRTSLLVIFGQVLPVGLKVLPVGLLLGSQFRPVLVF